VLAYGVPTKMANIAKDNGTNFMLEVSAARKDWSQSVQCDDISYLWVIVSTIFWRTFMQTGRPGKSKGSK